MSDRVISTMPDLLDFFESADKDNSGSLEEEEFVDVACRLGLVNTQGLEPLDSPRGSKDPRFPRLHLAPVLVLNSLASYYL